MGDQWLGEVCQAQAHGRGGSAWGQPARSPSRWRVRPCRLRAREGIARIGAGQDTPREDCADGHRRRPDGQARRSSFGPWGRKGAVRRKWGSLRSWRRGVAAPHRPHPGPCQPGPTWSSVLPSTSPPAALAEFGDAVAGPVVWCLVAPCSFVRMASLVPPPHFPTRRPDWRKLDARRWLRFRDLSLALAWNHPLSPTLMYPEPPVLLRRGPYH